MAKLRNRGFQKLTHPKKNVAVFSGVNVPTVATFAADPRGVQKTVESLGAALGDDMKLLAGEIVLTRVQQDVTNLKRSFGAIAGNLHRGTPYNRGHPLKLIADNIDIEVRETHDSFMIYVHQEPVFGSRDKNEVAELGDLYDRGRDPFMVKINLNYPGMPRVTSSTAFYRATSKNRAFIPGEFRHPGFPALRWKEALNMKVEQRLQEHAQDMINEIVEIEQKQGGILHKGDLFAGEEVYRNKKGRQRFRGATAIADAERRGLTEENANHYSMLQRDIRALRRIGTSYRR